MKVNETKKRSLLKAVSFRIIEIIVDSAILSVFVDIQIAIGLAITLEVVCLILYYLFERIWNKTDYGREIK